MQNPSKYIEMQIMSKETETNVYRKAVKKIELKNKPPTCADMRTNGPPIRQYSTQADLILFPHTTGQRDRITIIIE